MRARRSSLLLLLVVLLSSCTSKPPAKTSGARLLFARGGTVRVGIVADYDGPIQGIDPRLDPVREYTYEGWEMLRILERTLYQYSGRPTNEGGSVLRPDLATGPPTVSSDGLTWTIHIRAGIHYAPPFASQDIVAGDFINAFKREARLSVSDVSLGGDYGVYYSVIHGFEAYAKGTVDSISGISTPDPHTLVFTLDVRDGDFADRLVMPAISPIPTLASAPSAAYGAAAGHDSGYGPFLIASGPYMLEGSDALTPNASAKQQKPVAGFPAQSKMFILVRNPSWAAGTDPLRPAYPDRIEIHLFPSLPDIQKAIDAGRVDLLMGNPPTPQLPIDQFHRYQANPSLGRTSVYLRDTIRYVTMNLAVPPFDDVHVRKAANYIVNKAAFISSFGELSGEPATHVILDSLENDQLVNYDPYRTNGGVDALAKAQAEMRLSKYDPKHIGMCDARQCSHIKALALSVDFPPAVRAAKSVAKDLARIGIKLNLDIVDADSFFKSITTPPDRIGIGIAPGWGHDFLNASNFVTPLFAGPSVSTAFSVPGGGPGGCCNYALVGAKSASLKGWGYSVTYVPSVDDRINQCLQLVGMPQTQCWTSLDQYLSETIVPWVPLSYENSVNVVPARVVNYTYDQFTTVLSLDQIVVNAGPVASPS